MLISGLNRGSMEKDLDRNVYIVNNVYYTVRARHENTQWSVRQSPKAMSLGVSVAGNIMLNINQEKTNIKNRT